MSLENVSCSADVGLGVGSSVGAGASAGGVACWMPRVVPRGGQDLSGIRLTNDVIFKRVFSVPVVLCGLINGLLGYEGDDRVVEVTLKPTELSEGGHESKRVVLDLRAVDQRGRCFNVEVQKGSHGDIVARSMIYGSTMLVSQAKVGDAYHEVRPNIEIIITDARLFTQHEDVHTPASVYAHQHGFVVSGLLEWHFFELSKLGGDVPEACGTPLLKWLYLLHYGGPYAQGERALPADFAMFEEMTMAVKHFNEALQDEATMWAALKRSHDEQDAQRSLERSHAAGRAEGVAQGKAEGVAEGKDEGVAEGLAQGKAEGVAEGKAEVARKMLKMGMEVEVIATATGLDLDEVRRL